LASPQSDAITNRYRLFGMMKSNVNLGLLDADETLDRKSLSFGGLSAIMEQFIVWVSGAAQIPVTKLFGQSAQGLGATGEGDLNNYYDAIKARQDGPNRRHLEMIDQVLVRSAIGSFPDDLEFDWNPLFQASGLEQAQQDLADAQADSMNIEAGIIRPSHAMKRAQARGTYDITDEQIDEQIEREKDQDNGEFDNEGNPLPSIELGGTESEPLAETSGKAAQTEANPAGR
jgi:phage-related protein (TIGR01555 family)